jgi:hypothetical protein
MITIGYSTRSPKPELQEYFKKTCGVKNVQVIEKVNPNGQSLTDVYNDILNESENDIVVLCHDDIYFDNKSWGFKILEHFKKTDYGILGVAGSTILPKSGMWWEDRRKMVGIVNHEHEGKKWESKYSNDLGNKIHQTVLIDGLFMVVNKCRIQENFDNNVKGFHLYDVDFCFRNYIKDVKIGVMFNIRITHKSIGMTNEQWDLNRQEFSTKYQDQLPIKIKKTKEDKLKILLSCLNFKTFTGSEVYVYELAKGLINMGHDVTVLSEIGGPLTDKAKKLGIKVRPFSEPPGFKMGDGKWGAATPNGTEVSKEGMLYKIQDINYDIIHVQHEPVTNMVLQLYPNIEKIATIHSEVIDLEKPVKHESIKRYIAIRPEIKEHIVEQDEIDESLVDVIYNPIDDTRFNEKETTEENAVLFVGTIDYLREQTIKDLIEYTNENQMELWIVGENKSDYLDDVLLNKHVKRFPPTWNTETFVRKAKETAGILLGRTTIESWMCGKKSWIYNVDKSGGILSKELVSPPEDINKFYGSTVCEKLVDSYLNIINETSN